MTVCPGIKGAGCINVRTIQIFLTINKSHKVERLAKFKKRKHVNPRCKNKIQLCSLKYLALSGMGGKQGKKSVETEMIEWWLQEEGKFMKL